MTRYESSGGGGGSSDGSSSDGDSSCSIRRNGIAAVVVVSRVRVKGYTTSPATSPLGIYEITAVEVRTICAPQSRLFSNLLPIPLY